MKSLCLRAAGAALCILFVAAVASAQTYSVTGLDQGRVANSAFFAGPDQLAGTWQRSDGEGDHSFFYADGRFTDLGTLGGSNTRASAANAAGRVIGVSNPAGDADFRAFSWTTAGGIVELSLGSWSSAAAVNTAGQVVGDATLPPDEGGETRAFSWTPAGGIVNLGTLGGVISQAFAVSDAGEVVGDSHVAGDRRHAFYWTPDGGMVDLGTLGGATSAARAISASGQVFGQSDTDIPGVSRAFVWTPAGGMVGIGTRSTFVAADPSSGQVIGTTTSPDGSTSHAFLWTSDGGYVDLGNLGGSHTQPAALNASGQVVGHATTERSIREHAFLWTAAGGLVDLGTLQHAGTQPTSRALFVNRAGTVAGESSYFDGTTDDTRAFIWTPASGMVDLNDVTPSKPQGMVIMSPRALADDGAIIAETSSGSLVLLRPSEGTTNQAPVIGPIDANDPVELNRPMSARASFSDVDAGDAHTATWDWGDGSAPEIGTVTISGDAYLVAGTHRYATSGVYAVSLKVADRAGATSVASQDVVVYDTAVGAVAGRGWFRSAPGAYKADPLLAGRASFGFVSKYKKRGPVPKGSVRFEFRAASLRLRSESYDWLVVSGARAQLHGTGSLNGQGDYGFRLTAIDGKREGHARSRSRSPDRIRLEIWSVDPKTGADVIVYDNQIDPANEGGFDEGTPLRGGKIVIKSD